MKLRQKEAILEVAVCVLMATMAVLVVLSFVWFCGCSSKLRMATEANVDAAVQAGVTPLNARLDDVEDSVAVVQDGIVAVSNAVHAGRDSNSTLVMETAVIGLIALPVLGYWLPKLGWHWVERIKRRRTIHKSGCHGSLDG